jgi:hypothetical protein
MNSDLLENKIQLSCKTPIGFSSSFCRVIQEMNC